MFNDQESRNTVSTFQNGIQTSSGSEDKMHIDIDKEKSSDDTEALNQLMTLEKQDKSVQPLKNSYEDKIEKFTLNMERKIESGQAELKKAEKSLKKD
jgi:hypothetical protein